MTVAANILLVHGYSGSPDNLSPLASFLDKTFGTGSTTLIRLPGHGAGHTPFFDKQTFIQSVHDAITGIRKQGEKLVLVGHSTGGSLLLAALAESGTAPALLVLASVPKKIDSACLARWQHHRAGMPDIDFTSVASMISLVNAAGSVRFDRAFPVVILHGGQDELVPVESTGSWEHGSFAGPVRSVVIPRGVHDLFRGPNSAIAVAALCTSVEDILRVPSADEHAVVEKIGAVEPETITFVRRSAGSLSHLAASPSGLTAADLRPRLSPIAATAPTIANIEITTRCNLRCVYCARAMRSITAEDMSLESFRTILGLIPHAYRITLVGLGETLMHLNVVDFVAYAASVGRRVALVTNAMLLDEHLSRELLRAGLESIAFSIDGATQQIASDVRPGTDLARVVTNIRRFVELSRAGRPVSTAVFSAVSLQTVSSLEQLVELVSGIGVHVMMLSDLNFRENLSRTLWKNTSSETAALIRTAVAHAFRKKLPVLSVHGLEEFGLWKRYDRFLLLPPDRLYQRSSHRTWCCSPWQTVPISVRGEVTVCDCQPEKSAGNLLEMPLQDIWNGEAFVKQREQMLSDAPPEACRICPRF